jgi:hypothetical protein
MQSDYVLNGTWTEKNELKFYSNSQYSDLIQYYLVKDREKSIMKLLLTTKNMEANTGGQRKAAYNKGLV